MSSTIAVSSSEAPSYSTNARCNNAEKTRPLQCCRSRRSVFFFPLLASNPNTQAANGDHPTPTKGQACLLEGEHREFESLSPPPPFLQGPVMFSGMTTATCCICIFLRTRQSHVNRADYLRPLAHG